MFLLGFLFAAHRIRSGRMIKTSNKAVLLAQLFNITSYLSSCQKMPSFFRETRNVDYISGEL